jgi:uncharacterized protein YicC (UPF0701 family)
MLKSTKEIKTVAKGTLEEMTELESRLSLLFQSAQNVGINYKSVGLSLYAASKSKAWLEQFVNGKNSYDDEKSEIEESLCSIENSVRDVKHIVEQGGNIDKNLDFILEKVKNIENIVQSGRYE